MSSWLTDNYAFKLVVLVGKLDAIPLLSFAPNHSKLLYDISCKLSIWTYFLETNFECVLVILAIQREHCINHNSIKLPSRRRHFRKLIGLGHVIHIWIMSCPRVIGCVNTDVGQPINTRRSAQMSPRRPQPTGHSLHPDYTEHWDRKLLLLPETSP